MSMRHVREREKRCTIKDLGWSWVVRGLHKRLGHVAERKNLFKGEADFASDCRRTKYSRIRNRLQS